MQEALVYEDSCAAVKRKRVTYSLDDELFALTVKCSREEFHQELIDLEAKTEKLGNDIVASLKSQMMEDDLASFKCDEFSCHNRLIGHMASKKSFEFCSEACDKKFRDSVMKHLWESPAKVRMRNRQVGPAITMILLQKLH